MGQGNRREISRARRGLSKRDQTRTDSIALGLFGLRDIAQRHQCPQVAIDAALGGAKRGRQGGYADVTVTFGKRF